MRQPWLNKNCPVVCQKKIAVLSVSQKSVVAAQTRKLVTDKAKRKESTRKHIAIEGINSALINK